jgi:hypothetical protein
MLPIDFLTQRLNFNIGSISFTPSYFQAGAIIFLLFLLVVTLASMRRHFMTYSFRGAIFGLFFGFLLTLVLEGFLVISGRTAFTEVIGWKNAPKPILNVLEAGRTKLTSVLGVTDAIPSSDAKDAPTKEEVLNGYQSLNPAEAAGVRKMICAP